MAKQERLREAKQHGAAWFPFNIYPCTIPKDFPQVALHWQDSMELVFVKKGRGIVQAGLTTYTAQAGDIYVFAPGVLHALRQLPGEAMEYENIIFELELLAVPVTSVPRSTCCRCRADVWLCPCALARKTGATTGRCGACTRRRNSTRSKTWDMNSV